MTDDGKAPKVFCEPELVGTLFEVNLFNSRVSFCIDSVFDLIPKVGSAFTEIFYFDFLWFHFAIFRKL